MGISLFYPYFLSPLSIRNFSQTFKKNYWLLTAAFFSFFSGFLGTQVTLFIARYFDMILPTLLQSTPLESGFFLGLLTYAFGFLLYRFVIMRNYKEHAELMFLQSRLKSLETQLNPHFLFNALNSVSELLHVDPNKAEKSLLSLASFLRQSMKEEALISLEEELENTQNYLAIENIRFDDAITFEPLIPTKYLQVKVPKFSIQLLVENAIKHGYEKESFMIGILAELKHDKLLIHVQNNGTPPTHCQFGIGLKNLSERLKHLCGGELKHTSDILTRFTIIVGDPYETFDR